MSQQRSEGEGINSIIRDLFSLCGNEHKACPEYTMANLLWWIKSVQMAFKDAMCSAQRPSTYMIFKCYEQSLYCLKHTWKMTLNKVETITFQFTGIYYKNRIGWNGQLVKNKNAIVSLIKLKSSPVFSVPSVLSGSFPRNLEGFLSFTLNSVRSGNKA